eukprot:942896-Rhodomonas_salina.4
MPAQAVGYCVGKVPSLRPPYALSGTVLGVGKAPSLRPHYAVSSTDVRYVVRRRQSGILAVAIRGVRC